MLQVVELEFTVTTLSTAGSSTSSATMLHILQDGNAIII